MVGSPELKCPSCYTGYISQTEDAFSECKDCKAKYKFFLFPELFLKKKTEENLQATEGSSVCYFHPEKSAAIECTECGRLICNLCSIKIGEKTRCPGCLHSGENKEQKNERFLMSSLAFMLAVYPVLFIFTIYFTCITAPAAFVCSILAWRRPGPMFALWRWREIFALILSTIQIIIWIIGILALFNFLNLRSFIQ